MDTKLLHSTEYHQKGENPSLLILSGTHGDEYKVIDSVKTYVEENFESLPDFIFIPQVSPSAVVLKTRMNSRGMDLNRIFTDDSMDEEVNAAQSIIKPFHFRWCLSFHEDPGETAFYMYDSGLFETTILQDFRETLRSQNISLFTGIDDPDDLHLGEQITEGYYSLPSDYHFSHGFFMDYAIKNHICDRFLTLEIPGKVSQIKNVLITTVVFDALRTSLGY